MITLTCVPTLIMSWLYSRNFALGRFLGGHPEIYGSLHAHILAETLERKWGANKEKTLDLGVREQKDRSKAVKTSGGRWGKT